MPVIASLRTEGSTGILALVRFHHQGVGKGWEAAPPCDLRTRMLVGADLRGMLILATISAAYWC